MLVTLNPTANQTPDAGQGGLGVTGISNTGHSTTTASAANGNNQTKTARWFTFSSGVPTPQTLTLKVGWSVSGSLVIVVASFNSFNIEYTVNGGTNWTTLVSLNDITSPSNGTGTATLSATQNISQVQVRDSLNAQTTDVGDSASISGSTSSIRLEAVYAEANRMLIAGM